MKKKEIPKDLDYYENVIIKKNKKHKNYFKNN